jgi:hypothetical protein
MPSAPGVSSSEAKKLETKKRQAAEAKAKKKAYEAKAAPDTVEELVDANDLEKEWFKEGDWKPAWGHVEFVSSQLMRPAIVSFDSEAARGTPAWGMAADARTGTLV